MTGEKGRIGIVYKGGGAGSSRGISRQSLCLRGPERKSGMECVTGLPRSRRDNCSNAPLPRRSAMIIFYILLAFALSSNSLSSDPVHFEVH